MRLVKVGLTLAFVAAVATFAWVQYVRAPATPSEAGIGSGQCPEISIPDGVQTFGRPAESADREDLQQRAGAALGQIRIAEAFLIGVNAAVVLYDPRGADARAGFHRVAVVITKGSQDQWHVPRDDDGTPTYVSRFLTAVNRAGLVTIVAEHNGQQGCRLVLIGYEPRTEGWASRYVANTGKWPL